MYVVQTWYKLIKYELTQTIHWIYTENKAGKQNTPNTVLDYELIHTRQSALILKLVNFSQTRSFKEEKLV